MQFGGQGTPAVGAIFDSDMGNRIDTALALAVLFGLDGKNECRVSSFSTSKPNLQAAAFLDVLVRFYTGNQSFRPMPIGMTLEGSSKEPTPLLPIAAKYPHTIKTLSDTAEPLPLIRNAFTAQQDGNCFVVLAGPATNLAGVLTIGGAKDFVSRKVKYLVIADGEGNVQADLPAMKRLLAEWPTPIFLAATPLKFPASSIEKDFAWGPAHPVVDAYRAAGTMPYDAPAGEMAAVLYAVRPKEAFFQTSAPGVLEVGNDGKMRLVPKADGRHRTVTVDLAQSAAALKTLVELASAKPVIRAPRFRPPVADKAKPDEVRPTEAKPQA